MQDTPRIWGLQRLYGIKTVKFLSPNIRGILIRWKTIGSRWRRISRAKDEIMEWNLDDAMNTVMERMAA